MQKKQNKKLKTSMNVVNLSTNIPRKLGLKAIEHLVRQILLIDSF